MLFTKKSLMCGLLVFMSGHSVLATESTFFIRGTHSPIDGVIGPKGEEEEISLSTIGGGAHTTFPETTGLKIFHYKNYGSYKKLEVCTYISTSQKDMSCKTQHYLNGFINVHLRDLQEFTFIAIRSSTDKDTCKNMIQGRELPAPCLVIGPDDPQRRDVLVLVRTPLNTLKSGRVKMDELFDSTIPLPPQRTARIVSLPPTQGQDTVKLILQKVKPKSFVCIATSSEPMFSCSDSPVSSASLTVKLLPSSGKRTLLISTTDSGGASCSPTRHNSLCIKVQYTTIPSAH